MAEVLKFLRLSSEHSTVELATARDNPARKLGFAFVNVPVDSVEEVLQCNGITLGGRNIKGQEFAMYILSSSHTVTQTDRQTHAHMHTHINTHIHACAHACMYTHRAKPHAG